VRVGADEFCDSRRVADERKNVSLQSKVERLALFAHPIGRALGGALL